MKVTDALKVVVTGVFVVAFTGQGGLAFAGNAGMNVIERKTVLESVKSDLEDGLGLTPEQKENIAVIRQEFKAKQLAIKNALNAKHEALRQELDGDAPVRAKVEPVLAEIKALQGQLMDNRVDVVFKLREIYTPAQIKMIKERSELQRKALVVKKQGKKTKKTLLKHKD